VTTSSVLRAAQAHLHPEELRVVVVGDPSVIATPVSDVTGMPAEVVLPDPPDRAAPSEGPRS
jgi:hypothetical protein